MPKSDTQFSSTNQPGGRGKAFKTKLIESIKREALLDCTEHTSAAKVEERFLAHMAKRAFNPEDQASSTLLKELLSKSYASMKATMPEVEFNFDERSTPAEQVSMVMKAASQGDLPPDVAATFVGAIKASVDIEAVTDLKARIEKLEEMLINAGT